jgi:hypothetical protein
MEMLAYLDSSVWVGILRRSCCTLGTWSRSWSTGRIPFRTRSALLHHTGVTILGQLLRSRYMLFWTGSRFGLQIRLRGGKVCLIGQFSIFEIDWKFQYINTLCRYGMINTYLRLFMV